MDRKSNFTPFIYGRSSTIPANWIKIGPVDAQIIIGLAESLKRKIATRAFYKPTFICASRRRTG